MRTTTAVLLAAGFFLVPGTALADVDPETFPEAGDSCSPREARDTVHLPDGSVLECGRERGKFVWKLVSGPTETPVDEEEEEEGEETDPEPEPTPEPSPSPSPDPDEDEDEGGDDTEPGEGDEDEGEDEAEEEELEDTTVGGDTDPAEKEEEEVVQVEAVSDGSDTLPVTGGALTGLVVAALAALGLGGAATYFARKSKA